MEEQGTPKEPIGIFRKVSQDYLKSSLSLEGTSPSLAAGEHNVHPYHDVQALVPVATL